MSMYNNELKERFLELRKEEISNRIDSLLNDSDFIDFVLEIKSHISIFIDDNLQLGYKIGYAYASEYPLTVFDGLGDLDYSENDYACLLDAIINDKLADRLEYFDLEEDEDKEEYLREVEEICNDFKDSSFLYRCATDKNFKNEHFEELEDMFYEIKKDEYFAIKDFIESDIYKMLYEYEK